MYGGQQCGGSPLPWTTLLENSHTKSSLDFASRLKPLDLNAGSWRRSALVLATRTCLWGKQRYFWKFLVCSFPLINYKYSNIYLILTSIYISFNFSFKCRVVFFLLVSHSFEAQCACAQVNVRVHMCFFSLAWTWSYALCRWWIVGVH